MPCELDDPKITMNMPKYLSDWLEEYAIENGFPSRDEALGYSIELLYAEEFKTGELNNIQHRRLKEKREYFDHFDSVMEEFYDTPQSREILRRAHFYYTSKEVNAVPSETIKNTARHKKADKKTIGGVEELLVRAGHDDEVINGILDDLIASSRIANTTAGAKKKMFTLKMNKELDKLQMTTYRRDQILSAFHYSL